MSKKIALMIASALTALVLAVTGAVALKLAADGKAASADQVQNVSDTQTGPVAAPSAAASIPVDVWMARENTYRQRLDQANAQLKDAYAADKKLQDQVKQLQAQLAQGASASQSAPAAPAQQSAGMISRDEAAAIALAYVGSGTVDDVTLTQDQGVAVYTVTVSGQTVTIDARTGEVLVPGPAAAPSFAGHESEDDDGSEHYVESRRPETRGIRQSWSRGEVEGHDD